MKTSEKLLSLFYLKSLLLGILYWLTISNVVMLIMYLASFIVELSESRQIVTTITPSWFPLLSYPGMVFIYWLHRKVERVYRIEESKVDKNK